MKKIHRVIQGDDFAIRVTLLVGGSRYPVDGWSFWMTVKESNDDADVDALFQLSSLNGDVLPHGSCSVRIVGKPAATKDKPLGKYFFDIQGKSPTGEIHTLESGTFIIDAETTIAS